MAQRGHSAPIFSGEVRLGEAMGFASHHVAINGRLAVLELTSFCLQTSIPCQENARSLPTQGFSFREQLTRAERKVHLRISAMGSAPSSL